MSLQNTKQKTEDRVTHTPLKPGDVLRYSGRVRCCCYTSGIRGVAAVTNPVKSHE